MKIIKVRGLGAVDHKYAISTRRRSFWTARLITMRCQHGYRHYIILRIRSIIMPTWRIAMPAFLNEALRFYAMTCGRQPAMPKRRASFSEMRALQLATSTIQSLQSDRRSSRQCFSQAITSGWRRGFRHANAVALSSSSFADREIRNSSVSPVGIRALLLLLLLLLLLIDY